MSSPLADAAWLERARHAMVREQLEARGIADPRVLAAFERVPREKFVTRNERSEAYDDRPLPIGEGQTISQPYIVALTVESLRLKGTERVLEIGTGSGYEAAILSELARHVFSVERLARLARFARENLARAGYPAVQVRVDDGTLGWPEHAPFDAIAVSAGAPSLPRPLLEQLAVGGRLVIPVGPEEAQTLVRVTQPALGVFEEEELTPVRFVPLVGAEGWSEE